MVPVQVVQRRVDLMAKEGVVFQTGVEVGVNLPAKQLLDANDAVLLTCGATHPRDLPIPGTDDSNSKGHQLLSGLGYVNW